MSEFIERLQAFEDAKRITPRERAASARHSKRHHRTVERSSQLYLPLDAPVTDAQAAVFD